MSRSLRFLADEDFDHDIVRGVLRRLPDLEIVGVQDIGFSGQSDPEIRAWAAGETRVLLTHDVSTMKTHAYARVAEGQPMPGVFVVSQLAAVGQVIEAIVLVAECSFEGEWEGQVRHLPM